MPAAPPFRDHFFDFVYAMSVFTHLTEEAEKLWIRELSRIIRPGGCFMLTLRGQGIKRNQRIAQFCRKSSWFYGQNRLKAELRTVKWQMKDVIRFFEFC
ncbi:MAG TPA: class I SAM-dependent methyltransferase [Desulfobacterales bacterium]|nr:class I SAM-dependent methyltransferase [Desulfobacterales bacterium]